MQNLLEDLTDSLQADQSFISDGSILKNVVIEAALNMDPRLLALLMQSPTIKAHFFTKVASALVFDKVKFQDFVSNKTFLPDSYTSFKNRIGLTDGRDYLSQSRDVVLAWPYKDCVLEGGMTKEDKGRQEVFWNTTLAPDDITRLFEPKVLTGWKRWDSEAVAVGKAKPVAAVAVDDNFLIKGNNLLALHSLKARYAGKVKLIYIDPPYNTGNDGFRYNDRFNHSAWLTFMRNRLEVARELLSRDGAIFVNLDDGEAHYAKVLMDEVFGRDNFVANIIWQKKYAPQNDATWLSDDHDHILCFASRKDIWRPNKLERTEQQRSIYKNVDNDPRGDWASDNLTVKTYSAIYDYEVTSPTGQKIKPASGRCWAVPREKFLELEKDNRIWWGADGNNATPRYKRFFSEIEQGVTAQTVWSYEEVGHNQEAKRELQKLGISDNSQTPKPERLMQRIIHLATQPGDLVLDFFSGTGTTAAVAMKMGRRWIAVEQMEYIHDFPAVRMKKVIEGEQGGISGAVKWQGGGSFVYAELAQSNAVFAGQIEKATDTATLQELWADMKATGYLRPDVVANSFDNDAFASLSLIEAKRLLMDCLDANHLYVNLNSLGDADFEILDEDVQATLDFYGIDE